MIDLLPWHKTPLATLLARRQRLPHALLIHGQAGIGKVNSRARWRNRYCAKRREGTPPSPAVNVTPAAGSARAIIRIFAN